MLAGDKFFETCNGVRVFTATEAAGLENRTPKTLLVSFDTSRN